MIPKVRKLLLVIALAAVSFPVDNISAFYNLPDYVRNDITMYASYTPCVAGGSLDDVSPGNGEPNGLTFPDLEPEKMEQAIEQFIEKHAPKSPLLGTGKYAVASGEKTNLNPFLVYAHAQHESALAMSTHPGAQIKIHDGKNAFGRTATARQPHVIEASRMWYKWSSFTASVDHTAAENNQPGNSDHFTYIRQVYSAEIEKGLPAYIHKYAPSSDGNDEAQYVKVMQGYLDEMAEYAGAATGGSSGSTGSSSCCSDSSSGGGYSDLKDNAKTAMNYFTGIKIIGKNITVVQAAGIVGNLQQESGPDLNTKADNGTHKGIAQWDPSRWSTLGAFAKHINKDVYDLETQLRYIAWELGLNQDWGEGKIGGYAKIGTELSNIIGMDEKAVIQAADLIQNKYEVAVGQHTDKRRNNAIALYEKYKDGGLPGGGSGESCGGGTGNAADLQKYTLDYAHKEYRRIDRTTPTPAYAKAVVTAKDEGRYVGNNGIDCGGFVTTLIYDSGFDKSYNSNAKGGPTASQEAWAKSNWEVVEPANGKSYNITDLQAGDVAFVPNHSWIFVDLGPEDNFDSPTRSASASNGSRAPMAGLETPNYDNPTWYRKKA